jgi:hypothetical protein
MRGLQTTQFPFDLRHPKKQASWWTALFWLLGTTASLYTICRFLASKSSLTAVISVPKASRASGPFHWQTCEDDEHYQCGYIELPLDYTNQSDPRTVTIATTLYQPRPGHKSDRTLVIEPGGA